MSFKTASFVGNQKLTHTRISLKENTALIKTGHCSIWRSSTRDDKYFQNITLVKCLCAKDWNSTTKRGVRGSSGIVSLCRVHCSLIRLQCRPSWRIDSCHYHLFYCVNCWCTYNTLAFREKVHFSANPVTKKKCY